MPVFRRGEARILFIHVPKTGGTAIEKFFLDNGFDVLFIDGSRGPDSINSIRRCSPQHMHAAVLDLYFKLGAFDAVFMTVRHPIDRLMSEYRMHLELYPETLPFRQWLAAMLREYRADSFYWDNHMRPQSEFHVPGARVFHYEDGFDTALIETLEQWLKIDFKLRAFDRPMSSKQPHIRATPFDEECRYLVESLYAEDFTRFGYEFGTQSGKPRLARA